ncbi:MAG: SRPBCC family protein [Gammaproteobacteria bacterium]
MWKILFLGLLGAIAAVLVIAARRPDRFRLQRSIQVRAAPEAVYALIEDFHRWTQWSPWEHRDPAMQRSYEGPQAGVGAVYGWNGAKVGQGRMEILEAVPGARVRIKLDFLRPMQARNTAEFTLDARDGGTFVTWAMEGPQPFMAKVVSVFMDMERMVGPDFETGLANLQAAAERGALAAPA